MKRKVFLLAILLLLLIVFNCKGKKIKGHKMEKDGLYAVLKTSMGDIVCELYFKKTPITVASFVGLADGTIESLDHSSGNKVKKKFYEGIIFHRVIKGFVIQGGCPFGRGNGGPGYKFVDEFDKELIHNSAGILSMANSGPNTNGSQFFITLAPTPHLNGKHSVFGKVVKGMDVVEKIGNVETAAQDKPVKDVVINSVEILRVGKDAENFDEVDKFNNYEKELQKKQEKELKETLSKLNVDESKIVTTESGLQYYVVKDGSGKTPTKGDTIEAHYSLFLTNGKKIDSSFDRNQSFETEIGVGRVIKGWDEAFLKMKEGEKRVLILPYDLAYGENGYPPMIPPKATLIFEVELLKVK